MTNNIGLNKSSSDKIAVELNGLLTEGLWHLRNQ